MGSDFKFLLLLVFLCRARNSCFSNNTPNRISFSSSSACPSSSLWCHSTAGISKKTNKNFTNIHQHSSAAEAKNISILSFLVPLNRQLTLDLLTLQPSTVHLVLEHSPEVSSTSLVLENNLVSQRFNSSESVIILKRTELVVFSRL